MKRFLISLSFILSILIGIDANVFAVEPVKLEVKEIGDNVFIVLNHRKGFPISSVISDKKVVLISQEEMSFTNTSPALFNKYATSLSALGNKISFVMLNNFSTAPG